MVVTANKCQMHTHAAAARRAPSALVVTGDEKHPCRSTHSSF